MIRGPFLDLVGYLRRVTRVEQAESSDAALLERFVGGQEQAAFEALIGRHGPLVWDVCRNVLSDSHDAEDAFQATFLVLAKKAGAIRKHDSLASWLYGVAYRVAARARTAVHQQRSKEREAALMPRSASSSEPMSCEERAILHEEVQQLPEVYRRAIVLCHLQALTCEEAADQLGCRPGTIKSRLSRGRELLKQRLIRRGLTLSAAGLAATVAPPLSAAPASLVIPTARAALLAAQGKALTGILSAHVVALANAVLRGMREGIYHPQCRRPHRLLSERAVSRGRQPRRGPDPSDRQPLPKPSPLAKDAPDRRPASSTANARGADAPSRRLRRIHPG